MRRSLPFNFALRVPNFQLNVYAPASDGRLSTVAEYDVLFDFETPPPTPKPNPPITPTVIPAAPTPMRPSISKSYLNSFS